jgi:hypothetical protein
LARYGVRGLAEQGFSGHAAILDPAAQIVQGELLAKVLRVLMGDVQRRGVPDAVFNGATVRSVTVRGIDVLVGFAGPQGTYPGLDQMTASLP